VNPVGSAVNARTLPERPRGCFRVPAGYLAPWMRLVVPALLLASAIARAADPVPETSAGAPDAGLTLQGHVGEAPPAPILIATAPAPAEIPPGFAAGQAPDGALLPSGVPQGQWVYTSQYGWLWMPYDNTYTYLPPEGGVPDMYVYYPSVGWSWVVAPWIWGYGPVPYYGACGTVGFAWYGVGFGHWYGYTWPYAGWYGWGYATGGHWVGYHPAAPRSYLPGTGAGFHGSVPIHGSAPSAPAAPHGGGWHVGGFHK
jgi:hypothetical protein